MILVTLIEEEVINFFKNKINIITLFIFPIILIYIMGTTLNGLMGLDGNIFRDKTIYYKINNCDEKQFRDFYDFIIEFETSTKVNFVKVNKTEEAINNVNQNKAISFIYINGYDYKYFRNEKEEKYESKIFRNIFEQYYKKLYLLNNIKKNNPSGLNKIINNEVSISIISENISLKEVDSFTYYTFAQLVLIIFYISTIISSSMYEKRNLYKMTILKHSSINKFNILISKVVLGMIIGILQIAIVYLGSTKFFNVSWGENLSIILAVLVSFIIFSSMLGVSVAMIFSNQKTTAIINNALILVMGFLGGSYVPIYLIQSDKITSFLSIFSPIYWMNISLISLIHSDSSTYYINCIGIFLALSILLLLIVLAMPKREVGGSFD